jgi:glycosyltransferase involved in cell wall biosynthesis
MAAAAVVALPSTWLEGLPRVAVEAMARGRALLAVDHGGRGSVVDDSCGWRLSADVDAWSDLLGALPDSEVVRRGAGARAVYESRYDETVTTRQLVSTYEEVLAP